VERKRLVLGDDILEEISVMNFYRAMQYSAKRGIAIACRLSVRL